MTFEVVLKLILVSLFCACFGSFIWGMARFFRISGQVPIGIRIVQIVGGTMLVLHFVILCRGRDFSAAVSSTAACLYVASFALFWSAVSVHRHRPPTLCYSSDIPVHLIVSGPYRWVRHPFYTSYMLAWLGGIVASHQPWLVLSLLIMSALYFRAARLEESKFAASSLAVEFADYSKRTGMFLPRIV